MTLELIVNALDSLKVYENRFNDSDYHELVFFTADTEMWTQALSEFLGEPYKAADEQVTPEHKELTGRYGSIADNQTLFYKTTDSMTYIAMYWPWGNGEFTTLKLIEISS